MTLSTEVGNSLELPAGVSVSSNDRASLKTHQAGLVALTQESLLKDSHGRRTNYTTSRRKVFIVLGWEVSPKH